MNMKDHNTTISTEDIQFNGYKEAFQKGEKFLRSKWRNSAIKHTENDKTSKLNSDNMVALEEMIKPGTSENKKKSSALPMSGSLVISSNKSISSGNKLSKSKLKKIIESRDEPKDIPGDDIPFLERSEDINPIDMIIQSDPQKFQSKCKIEKGKSTSHLENPKNNNTLIKIRNDQNTIQQTKFTIFPKIENKSETEANDTNEQLLLKPFIETPNSEEILAQDNDILPYEIIPSYKNLQCKAYSKATCFPLFEKMRYNKIIKEECYIGRYILIKKREAQFKLGKITQISTSGKKIAIEYVSNNNFNEDKLGYDDAIVVPVVINLESSEYEIYMIEYMFQYISSSDSRSKNLLLNSSMICDDNPALYGIIISKFKTKESLITRDSKENINYTGFIVNNEFNFYYLNKISSDRLEIIDEKKISEDISLKFYQEINLKYKRFLKDNEFVHQGKHNLNDFILHECLIWGSELCLLMNYNNTLSLAFIRRYKSGKCDWVPLNPPSQSLYINILKGPVVINSINNISSKPAMNYYLQLSFTINDPLPCDFPNYEDKIIIPKNMDGVFIMAGLECNKCTYKINQFEYRFCCFCSKIYHIGCIDNIDRQFEVLPFRTFWACLSCKPCQNCHSGIDERVTCATCHSCYHITCINDIVKSVYPKTIDNGKWKCETCLKCKHCDATVESLSMKKLTSAANETNNNLNLAFSPNFETCIECEKRIEKKEYCPICKKLWLTNEKNMIECKCKFWIHKECDRILSDFYFKKSTKKSYHCPSCRTKKKNKNLHTILKDIIDLDKNGFFYNPVDVNIVKNYSKIIKTPMCFSQMEAKLKENVYLLDIDEFIADLFLIFKNAMTFNMPNTTIYKLAENINQNAKQILEGCFSLLYQQSFEYYLFDYNNSDSGILYSTDPEKYLKNIDEILKSKFLNKISLMKVNHIQGKLNEYKVNWPILRESLAKNFNISTERERELGNESEVATVKTSMMMVDEKEENVERVNDLPEPKSQFAIPLINDNVEMSGQKIIQIKLEDNENLNGKEKASSPPENDIHNHPDTLKINDITSSQQPTFNNPSSFTHHLTSSTTIQHLPQIKKSLMKSNEFQQELDYHNSNFEVNRKTNKQNIRENLNINSKMEIFENNPNQQLDNNLNPFLSLEEEEENVLKAFDKARQSDHRLMFLYPNKFKNYFIDSDYFGYLDFVSSYVMIKDDKKKKCATGENGIVSNRRNSFEKEVRPKKKLKLGGNKKISSTLEDVESLPLQSKERQGILFFRNRKGRLNKSKNKNGESMSINNHLAKNNISPAMNDEISSLISYEKNNRNNPPVAPLEFFGEDGGITQRSLLPGPAQICFSSTELIFEKNCYLCGSFDNPELFLTCSVCFENFHSYCISSSIVDVNHDIALIKSYNWKCQNCKFCECCRTNENDNVLLYCDSCDRALHIYCLEVPLMVVPESGWKCSSCFKCRNCGSKRYYMPDFPIKKDKDYSIFTRNFNYCFECGMRMFYNSFCNKCQKSDYRNYTKNLVFISNLKDFTEKFPKEIDICGKDSESDLVMLNCSICKNWFHSTCLGLDSVNLNYYFQQYQVFNCLDCHISQRYGERYMEVAYIKYLDVLKMSYIVMCFSKLVMIILKSLQKNSNIKLHSKLLKIYLKENFNTLLKDKNMCMLLELIRNDVFLLKDKSTVKISDKTNKNETKIQNENDTLPLAATTIPPTSTTQVIKTSNPLPPESPLNLPPTHSYVHTYPEKTYDSTLIETMSRKIAIEKFKSSTKIDKNYLYRQLNKYEAEKYKKISSKKNKTKRLFDITGENLFHGKHFKNLLIAKTINNDINALLCKPLCKRQILKHVDSAVKAPETVSTNGNIMMHDGECNNNSELKVNNENVMIIVEQQGTESIQSNSNIKMQKRKKKRIGFINDKKFQEELSNFFKKTEPVIHAKGLDVDDKLVDVYDFDIEKYYKSPLSPSTSSQIINEVLSKMDSYMKTKSFGKRLSRFIFQIIFNVVILLRTSLYKWLISQLLSNESGLLCVNMQYIQKNNLFPYIIDLSDKIINEHPIMSETNTEISEEEIQKFLDYIDPLDMSPGKNLNCEFCNRKGGRKISGRLINIKNESWGHINCITWSKGVYIVEDGNIMNVIPILHKVKFYKCTLCRKLGATVVCDARKCGKSFHFACAQARQCVFTKKREFYCSKCSHTSKEDTLLTDFSTHQMYTVIKTQDERNQLTNNNNSNIKNPSKFQLGTFNKFGNTTLIKLLQLNNKDNSFDKIDIAMMKFINKDYNNPSSNNTFDNQSQNLLLFLLNENGVSLSNISFGKNNIKDLEELLFRMKILNCFSKTEHDTTLIMNNLKGMPNVDMIAYVKNEINLSINTCTNRQERMEMVGSVIAKGINTQLEEFLFGKVLSEEEIENGRRVNKRYDDVFNFFNISFSLAQALGQNGGVYLKSVVDVENSQISGISQAVDTLENKAKREQRNKLDRYVGLLKEKNKPDKNGNQHAFKLSNYIENHQQFITSKADPNENNEPHIDYCDTGENKKTKLQKQMYKNLKKTMSTNIMETNIPLAMKFRNYKSLRPKVTIGPSIIHRNGLFALDTFQPGEIVIEYVGELISNKIADYREKEYNLRGFGDCYMFRLDQNQIVKKYIHNNISL